MDWIPPLVVFIGVIVIWIGVERLQTRLGRVERKINALLRHFNIDAAQGVALSDRVQELARDPKCKTAAIKLYREETGASLVEAKDAIEAFISSM